ncbi:MAG: DUF72 domain-containing protein [bacterium]
MNIKFHIGTSGWYYNHWFGRFYPEDIPKNRWFNHYCKHFTTVELNSPFYRMPSETTVKSWLRRAPVGFLYVIKANKMISHIKRLKGVKDITFSFIDTISGLGDMLGCVLLQLPPSLKIDTDLLCDFISILPENIKWAIEFRNKTWFSDDIYNLLKSKNISFCSVSYPGLPEEVVKTADFIYLRMHGIKERYASLYSTAELKIWLDKIILEKPKKVFIYFNNDYNAYAVKNAIDTIKLIKILSI